MSSKAVADTGAGLNIRQLFDRESCTYTYIVQDPVSSEALIIDPVIGCHERDVEALEGMCVSELQWIANTHIHADHVTGSARLRAHPRHSGARTVVSKASGGVADRLVCEGETLAIGDRFITVVSTPGHTPGCITFVTDDKTAAFTGDALLIRGCGRTDFQGGDPAQLFDSVWSGIFSLPDATKLWPGHDYTGRTVTTVGEEKRSNPRLTLAKDKFVQLMLKKFDGSNYPGAIDVSLPANMVCGVYEPLPDGTACWDPALGTPVVHPGGFTWTPRSNK
eukprot:g2446.t1